MLLLCRLRRVRAESVGQSDSRLVRAKLAKSRGERQLLFCGSSGFRVGDSRPNGPLRCLTEHGR